MARHMDVETVVRSAIDGDDGALAALFRLYQPRLLRYTRAYVGGAAEDLASEVWVDVTRNVTRFSGDADDFRAWLFTIAAHRVADLQRRLGRQAGSVALHEHEENATAARVHDPAEDVAGDAAASEILALLPPHLAEIVLLRVVGDLSVDQVAAITRRRPGTIRVMQHRALRQLAEQLHRRL
jgi:RNA polymerase sigma-70 factor, ECF subfamily